MKKLKKRGYDILRQVGAASSATYRSWFQETCELGATLYLTWGFPLPDDTGGADILGSAMGAVEGEVVDKSPATVAAGGGGHEPGGDGNGGTRVGGDGGDGGGSSGGGGSLGSGGAAAPAEAATAAAAPAAAASAVGTTGEDAGRQGRTARREAARAARGALEALQMGIDTSLDGQCPEDAGVAAREVAAALAAAGVDMDAMDAEGAEESGAVAAAAAAAAAAAKPPPSPNTAARRKNGAARSQLCRDRKIAAAANDDPETLQERTCQRKVRKLVDTLESVDPEGVHTAQIINKFHKHPKLRNYAQEFLFSNDPLGELLADGVKEFLSTTAPSSSGVDLQWRTALLAAAASNPELVRRRQITAMAGRLGLRSPGPLRRAVSKLTRAVAGSNGAMPTIAEVVTRSTRSDVTSPEKLHYVNQYWMMNTRVSTSKADVISRPRGVCSLPAEPHAKQFMETSQTDMFCSYCDVEKEAEREAVGQKIFEENKPWFVRPVRAADRLTCCCEIHVRAKWIFDCLYHFATKLVRQSREQWARGGAPRTGLVMPSAVAGTSAAASAAAEAATTAGVERDRLLEALAPLLTSECSLRKFISNRTCKPVAADQPDALTEEERLLHETVVREQRQQEGGGVDLGPVGGEEGDGTTEAGWAPLPCLEGQCKESRCGVLGITTVLDAVVSLAALVDSTSTLSFRSFEQVEVGTSKRLQHCRERPIPEAFRERFLDVMAGKKYAHGGRKYRSGFIWHSFEAAFQSRTMADNFQNVKTGEIVMGVDYAMSPTINNDQQVGWYNLTSEPSPV